MHTNNIAIKTNNLSRNFGNRVAVNNLNIEIKKGEIFSLLGTNGAGKTTTIKMLCCLLQPSSGNALINNLCTKEQPLEIKKIIGVSPQETAIAGHLTSMENLLLMGGVSGLNRSDSKNRAKNLMKLLEIEDRKDQTRKLSGGLQRRLSIAMSLMSDPQILFLDEPTLGLDPQARKSVWNYIEKLKKDKTILLTTHYLEEADSLADTIAIMDKGNIIEIGSSSDLKRKFSNKKVLKIDGQNISQSIADTFLKQGYEAVYSNNTLEIQSSELDFYAIIDFLKSNNVMINSIQMKEPSLDDVFLRIAGKEATA